MLRKVHFYKKKGGGIKTLEHVQR